MKITGLRSRRGCVGVAIGLVAGAVFAAPHASAVPAPAPAAVTIPAQDTAVLAMSTLSTSLSEQLGTRTAGSYQDAAGRLVVNVTDGVTARTVTEAGAVARYVTRSGTTLARATAALQDSARISGTSWATDPISNQVVVTADSTVTGARLAMVRAVVARLGDAARLETMPGTLSTRVAGGDAIFGGGFRCSLGFNVTGAGGAYFLTAGHCTNAAVTWSGPGGEVLGVRVQSSFPGNDFGVVQYTTGAARPGGVNLYNGTVRDITSAASATVGQVVNRSGSTTGLRSGQVTAVNATVNYPQGQVTGLIRTSACAQGGDSGGSLFAGTVALGLTSGGSGDCTVGGTTFFQPVVEVLNAFGLTIS